MREFHVSLRTPNKHYKVPKAVFLERVCITWENLLRLRQWCLLHTGEDPEVDGFDQKPFHMNEAGSKRQKTLSFKGIQVELRQGHSATRERWTATTYTTSDLLRAAKPLPLEVCVKGGPIVGLCVHAAADRLCDCGDDEHKWLTGRSTDSGSYKTEDILAFLKKHLEHMRAGRAWRILL